ncbi:unnamed protein product [Effrenium voratum]|nr:unnamed protein product [Effrenium voratum]
MAVPAQSELRRWPAEGLKVKGRRCLPYARTAQQFAGARKLHFLHEPLEDLEVPGSEHLHAFTNKLEARLHQGETLLVHCMGGRGRSNLVAGCLLAKLYDLPADEVEQRLQLGYESRDYDNCLVPETQRQRVNNLLQVTLTKVEQCASGAIYCQIIDACQPGSVAMRKVNWMAKAEHEYIPNFKVLQVAFDRLEIERNIAVDQLIRAKYQDNLEFLQWMKCYWEREGGAGRRDYDAVAVREGKPLPTWAKPLNVFGGRGLEKENLKPKVLAKEDRPREEKKTPPARATASKTPRPAPRSMNSSLNTSLNTSSAAENEAAAAGWLAALKVKLEAQNEVPSSRLFGGREQWRS